MMRCLDPIGIFPNFSMSEKVLYVTDTRCSTVDAKSQSNLTIFWIIFFLLKFIFFPFNFIKNIIKITESYYLVISHQHCHRYSLPVSGLSNFRLFFPIKIEDERVKFVLFIATKLLCLCPNIFLHFHPCP